jgi:hypothetical protein
MAAMSPGVRVVLLVVVLAVAVSGLAVGVVYHAMLAAAVAGLVVTDWWKWIWVALLTLPVWFLYRAVFVRRR